MLMDYLNNQLDDQQDEILLERNRFIRSSSVPTRTAFPSIPFKSSLINVFITSVEIVIDAGCRVYVLVDFDEKN